MVAMSAASLIIAADLYGRVLVRNNDTCEPALAPPLSSVGIRHPVLLLPLSLLFRPLHLKPLGTRVDAGHAAARHVLNFVASGVRRCCSEATVAIYLTSNAQSLLEFLVFIVHKKRVHRVTH